jgi:hypothetical protein
MGRGNACVWGDYESIHYVPYTEFENYPYNPDTDESDETKEKEFDEYLLDDFISNISCDFVHKFNSFILEKTGRAWIDNETRIIAQNNLYYLAIQDNQWSLAIKLIQKDDLESLQKKHFKSYKKALVQILFDYASEVYGYDSAWTSRKLENPQDD